MARLYPQKVYGRMRRIRDSVGGFVKDVNGGKCYLVRDQTKIKFDNTEKLIATVFMTNPGSYGFDRIDSWGGFVSGIGEETELKGWGYPDPTMRNVIWAIQSAYDRSGYSKPEGYVRIINASNIVCPKGEDAEHYHNEVKNFIEGNERDFLSEPFEDSCVEESPIVIIGFLKDKFEKEVRSLEARLKPFNEKIVCAKIQDWPVHPVNWVRRPHLGEEIINKLVIQLNKQSN